MPALTAHTLSDTDSGSASVDPNAHAIAAYHFARHVRHDVANHQGAIQMMETVRRMSANGGAALPPELQPAAMMQKMQDAAIRIANMAYDMVLLSQSASPVALRHRDGITPAATLLNNAIAERLAADAPRPAGFDAVPEDLQLRGDEHLLSAALTASYFQWSANTHAHDRAADTAIEPTAEGLALTIPADDPEAAIAFSDQLRAGEASLTERLESEPQSVSTPSLALWLARFIVVQLGGDLRVERQGENASICMRLAGA